MEATKMVTWKTKDGKEVEIEITKTREVQDKTSNLDGDIVKLGKETVDSLYIEVRVNGAYKTRSCNEPDVVTPKFYRNYEQIKAAGAYARLGDVFISEEQYNMIIAVITELEAEVTGNQEFAKVKAQEEAREVKRIAAEKAEAAQYTQLKKSGLCPKCGTWCYGDCEANR